jgi:hypothetical protein
VISETKKTAAVVLALMFSSAGAHHSWSRYDGDNVITLEVVITEVQWANPHVVMRFDTVNAEGATENWVVEMDPPSLLSRFGMRHDSVRPGMRVKITGVPALSGAKAMRSLMMELPDGTTQRTSSRI